MKRYAIAGYLTEAERLAACAAEYTSRESSDLYPTPVTEDGCCPLGVALRVNDPGASRTPPSGIVAASINRRCDVAIPILQLAAKDFMADWDTGGIPPADLPIALGLEEVA